jgi:hypothetical protein
MSGVLDAQSVNVVTWTHQVPWSVRLGESRSSSALARTADPMTSAAASATMAGRDGFSL